MESLCGLTEEQFQRLYHRDRLELDRGTLTTEAYWGRILQAAGRRPEPGLIARIEEEDSLGWTRLNPSMVSWAQELRSAGYVTAILSNMPPDKLRFMRERPQFDFIRDFSVALFSCDYLLVKPERAFFEKCLQLLDRPAEECAFLDDSPVNVEAARALGMKALVFDGVPGALPVLEAEWRLPVRSLRGETIGPR